MGQTAAKASVQLFLPFVDDAATRRWALWVLTYTLWGPYEGEQIFYAKEPIVTPDEFLRVASHLGSGEDEVHTPLIMLLLSFARADTIGDGNRVLGPAVASIMPQIMDLIRNDKRDLRAHSAMLLAEGAIVAAAGVADFLARNLVQSDVGDIRTPWAAAIRRIAEVTTAPDDVPCGSAARPAPAQNRSGPERA